jgi:hypothetical protein
LELLVGSGLMLESKLTSLSRETGDLKAVIKD